MSWAAAPAARRFDGTPAAPAFSDRGGHDRAAARGRVGGRNEIGARPSHVVAGLAPRRHPKVHPTPAGPRPRRRRNRPTTRPAREPCLTGLSLGGDEPAVFRMATAPGTNEYRDRPGLVPRHSRPDPAGRGRRSPHECWVRLVLGLGGQESRLPSIDKPGRRPMPFAAAAVTPEKRRQRNAEPPWPWKLFSLDSENLMRVRRQRNAEPPRGRGNYSLLTARTL